MKFPQLLPHLTLLSVVSCMPWPLAGPLKRTSLVERASSPQPTPLSLTPSQYWDGDDGKWSTFEFQIGTPPQQIRLLPGTSTSTVYFIAPQGCSADANDTASCPHDRGETFNPDGSSTWAPLGTYQYQGNYSQSSLNGYLANSEYGDDVVTLAWPGSPAPTIQNQIVGGLLEKSIWYVGNFGISPRALNITYLSNSHPAPLQSLRDQNIIPSTSWGYTAGFYKNAYPTLGSLTLGGYDTTRFRSNGVSFPFGNDISRDLLVSIQSISSPAATSAGSLLPNPINAFIDSTIPAIWLPLESCRAFERAFNLTWDNSTNYYLLTDDQHAQLQAANPTITITLGSSLAGGSTVDIVLPYAAFDLQLTSPIADQPTYYFPLQRAANSTQYTLGRTFLQHAYVIADYDRSNFTVAQALFPQQNIQPMIEHIRPPGSSSSSSSSSSNSLSGGAIAGIVIGVIALLSIIALAVLYYIKRRRATHKPTPASSSPETEPSILGPTSPQTTIHASPAQREMAQYDGMSVYEKAELDVARDETGTPFERSPGSPGSPFGAGAMLAGKTELSADGREVHEAPAGLVKEKRGELDSTPATKRVEMDAGQVIAEMDGFEAAAKEGNGEKKPGPGGSGSGSGAGGGRGRGSGAGPVYEMEA